MILCTVYIINIFVMLLFLVLWIANSGSSKLIVAKFALATEISSYTVYNYVHYVGTLFTCM